MLAVSNTVKAHPHLTEDWVRRLQPRLPQGLEPALRAGCQHIVRSSTSCSMAVHAGTYSKLQPELVQNLACTSLTSVTYTAIQRCQATSRPGMQSGMAVGSSHVQVAATRTLSYPLQLAFELQITMLKLCASQLCSAYWHKG